MQKRVLSVDDNADHSELLKIFFEQQGYEFHSCETYEECLAMAPSADFPIIILDNILRFEEGAEIFFKIKSAFPLSQFLFFTADARDKSRERALGLGAAAYLVKPNDIDNVVQTVDSLLSRQAA